MRAGHGRGSRPHWWGAKWRWEATGSRRGAGAAGTGCRRAGGLCGSNPAKPQRVRTNRERMQQPTSAGSGFAVALPFHWHCAQCTGTTTANAGTIQHAQAPIGALFGVHARSASAKPDSAGSHPAAEQNLGPRSAPLSILIPPEEERHLPEVLCEAMQAEWQEQTRDGARRLWLETMSQFQSQIPDPLGPLR